MLPFRGVILDVDGTLVDSNLAHARAWTEVLQAAGYREVSVEGLWRLIGMGSDKLLPTAVGLDKDSPEGEWLSAERKRVFEQRYLPHLQPTPGAPELLARLREDGHQLMVASSADEQELGALLAICGAPDLARSATSSAEVKSSKPDPDVVQVALRKVGLPASDVVMLGDTPYDVRSAEGAGVSIIGVRCGGWSDADLAGAIAVYADPADLLAAHAPQPR